MQTNYSLILLISQVTIFVNCQIGPPNNYFLNLCKFVEIFCKGLSLIMKTIRVLFAIYFDAPFSIRN